MATRQKSFFEKESKKPFRPHYSRTRSANDVSQPNGSPKRSTMTKPPIAPGPQTKAKLKAFQFIEGRPSSQQYAENRNKENHAVVEQDTAPPKPTEQTPLKSSSQPEPVERRLPPPSTPAPRLPLADLLGNADGRRALASNITPEEHVLWVHAQTPGSSQPVVTPAKKRKRAKSSSPASSQQEPLHQETYSSGKLNNSFNTPQVDPAADLWQRYANGTEGPTADKPTAFSHLIRDSSPNSPATVGSVGGLRRWASCGIEWPQSATKRRRISRRVDELPRQDEDVADSGCKVSKVGALLERMKETLTKPTHDLPEGPSSSSPLPGRTVMLQESSRHSLAMVQEQDEHSPTQKSRQENLRQLLPPKSPSSDYGDDEIDVDMIDAIDSTAKIIRDASQPNIRPTPVIQPEESKKHMHQPPSQGLAPAVVAPAHGETQVDFDEFDDDDDDDLFAAVDLENLTAQCISQNQLGKGQGSQTEKELQKKRQPPAVQSIKVAMDTVQVISDDEFGDDDIDDEQFAAVEVAATQAFHTSGSVLGSSESRSQTIQRYLITAIQDGMFLDDVGRQQPEKILLVEESRTNQKRKIMLRQSWYETPATIGSHVHVTGTFDGADKCIIDNASNILILHPDHLISATVVADSFGCIRRAVLQDRVKATGDASPPMMYGHILHELFQEAMKGNEWDNAALEKYLDVILPRHYETMVEIGLNLSQVHEHLQAKFPEMQAWAELFVRAAPRRDAIVKGRNGQQAIMSINKLLDVEEHIWSPNYGLKGNIDATVQATISDGSQSRLLTVPFELKTGKRFSEHHVAQTALYTLLTTDRYDVKVMEGILYYLENSHITRVQAIRHELIHLIMKRNELACYVRDRLQLPPMLPGSRQRLCNNCYAQTTCFLYHKLSEDGTSQTIENKGKYEELVKYLKPTDQTFFKKWDQLLTKEESEMKKFTRELWTMVSKEREKRGRCFGNVIIEHGSAHELSAASKINRFQYTFIKQKPVSGFSFTESQITVGEPIVVSDEIGHYALAKGYVTHVHKKRITVAVDRRLHKARTRRPGFDPLKNQDFVGVMEALATSQAQVKDDDPVLYRLDKDEFSSGMATARNNMLQLMDDTVFKAASLRAMIVQDRAPSFKPSPSAFALQSQNWQSEMNTDQKAAIEKVMAAQDYALVLGMPGTGKTTTIAQIIKALVAKGKTVLLTSYTHTAVDNILLKVRGAGFDVLRLGVLAKIHPQVQEFTITAAEQKESLEEVKDAWFKPPVVATTCLGVNHPLFNKRAFDYCIVDEASQVTLPVCVGPIRMAKTFILVGDHYQLPPLVQNKEAQEGGLDMSLFRLLCERHPKAVVNLEHQYRMCADVMHLSNTLIYSGRLKCGTSAVAEQALMVSNPDQSMKMHHFSDGRPLLGSGPACSGASPSCHFWQALQPQNKVLFFNTDTLLPASSEILSGPRITNPFEAALTTRFVLSLLDAGLNPSDLGVITFYRSQLAELRQMLRSQPSIELHTADKFQGRDKEAVVVSFVRSNEDKNVGELLKDWRRINVAITRAKTKLILIGSKSTLSNGGDVLRGLVEICEQKGWMHDLTSGEHLFPELATQMTGVTQGSPLKNASPFKQGGRKVLGEIGAGKLNQARINGVKIPEKKGKIVEKAITGARPVLRDVMHDVLDHGLED